MPLAVSLIFKVPSIGTAVRQLLANPHGWTQHIAYATKELLQIVLMGVIDQIMIVESFRRQCDLVRVYLDANVITWCTTPNNLKNAVILVRIQ